LGFILSKSPPGRCAQNAHGVVGYSESHNQLLVNYITNNAESQEKN